MFGIFKAIGILPALYVVVYASSGGINHSRVHFFHQNGNFFALLRVACSTSGTYQFSSIKFLYYWRELVLAHGRDLPATAGNSLRLIHRFSFISF